MIGINRYRIDKIRGIVKHKQFNAWLRRVRIGVIGGWEDRRILNEEDMQQFSDDYMKSFFKNNPKVWDKMIEGLNLDGPTDGSLPVKWDFKD